MLLMLMLAVGCFQRTDDHHHPHRPETAADRNMQLVERAANALNDLSPRRSHRALALTTHAASASNGLGLAISASGSQCRPTDITENYSRQRQQQQQQPLGSQATPGPAGIEHTAKRWNSRVNPSGRHRSRYHTAAAADWCGVRTGPTEDSDPQQRPCRDLY